MDMIFVVCVDMCVCVIKKFQYDDDRLLISKPIEFVFSIAIGVSIIFNIWCMNEK